MSVKAATCDRQTIVLSALVFEAGYQGWKRDPGGFGKNPPTPGTRGLGLDKEPGGGRRQEFGLRQRASGRISPGT